MPKISRKRKGRLLGKRVFRKGRIDTRRMRGGAAAAAAPPAGLQKITDYIINPYINEYDNNYNKLKPESTKLIATHISKARAYVKNLIIHSYISLADVIITELRADGSFACTLNTAVKATAPAAAVAAVAAPAAAVAAITAARTLAAAAAAGGAAGSLVTTLDALRAAVAAAPGAAVPAPAAAAPPAAAGAAATGINAAFVAFIVELNKVYTAYNAIQNAIANINRVAVDTLGDINQLTDGTNDKAAYDPLYAATIGAINGGIAQNLLISYNGPPAILAPQAITDAIRTIEDNFNLPDRYIGMYTIFHFFGDTVMKEYITHLKLLMTIDKFNKSYDSLAINIYST